MPRKQESITCPPDICGGMYGKFQSDSQDLAAGLIVSSVETLPCSSGVFC